MDLNHDIKSKRQVYPTRAIYYLDIHVITYILYQVLYYAFFLECYSKTTWNPRPDQVGSVGSTPSDRRGEPSSASADNKPDMTA